MMELANKQIYTQEPGFFKRLSLIDWLYGAGLLAASLFGLVRFGAFMDGYGPAALALLAAIACIVAVLGLRWTRTIDRLQSVTLAADAADAAALIIIPLLFGVFTGILGLVENLRHPSLDWSNEAQAVKTGVGLLFTMLISWAALIPPIVLYAACDVDFNICAWGFAAAIAAADILLYRWLMSHGAEIYAAL